MLGGRVWIIWPRASWYRHSGRLRFRRGTSSVVPVITATSRPPWRTSAVPMASRRPRCSTVPGRDQLLPVRVDWAEEVDLHVEGGKVGAALDRRLDSGGGGRHPQQGDGAPEDPTVLLAQPSAGRHGEHHPARPP